MECQATNHQEDPRANHQGVLEHYPKAVAKPIAAAAGLCEAEDSAKEASAMEEEQSAEELLADA